MYVLDSAREARGELKVSQFKWCSLHLIYLCVISFAEKKPTLLLQGTVCRNIGVGAKF